MLDEIELNVNLTKNQKITEAGIGNIHTISPLKKQIQKQQTKVSGRRFDEIN